MRWASEVWLIGLLAACDGSDKEPVVSADTPTDLETDTGPPGPTDTPTDTGPTGPTTTNRPTDTGTADNPCDEPLEATIPQPGVLARQDLRVEATGGSGDVVFSLADNASGATVNPTSGNYLAGGTSGVIDVVQVDDLTCGTAATVSIEVYLSLDVVPLVATVAPGTTFDIEVDEGSGSWRCEDGLLQSGGGLATGTCTYTAGESIGAVDQVLVIDDLTGETVELLYTVSDDVELIPWAEAWLLPLGHPHLPITDGGSGALDIAPPAGLDWDGTYLTGANEGTYDVTLTDRFTGETAEVSVVVSAAHSPTDAAKDSERFDWFDTAWGDLNGDGFDDVVVASVDGGVAGYLGGGIYVFLGSATGLESEPAQTFGYPEPYGYGGRSVALGDIDDDGLLDLAWGAPGANEPGSNDLGVVRLHRGLGDGSFEAEPTWERWGEHGGDQLGYQVALCDVSGDGADDLVAVALRGEDRTASEIDYDTGELLIFPGNPGGPSLQPSWRAAGVYPDGAGGWTTRNTGWGYQLATGDIDGDGACDVVLSHYFEGPEDNLDYGMVWRYLATDLTGAAPVYPSRIYSSLTESQFGRPLDVGDVDGDGLDDLLVGARLDDTLLSNGGAAYLFLAADDDGRPAAELVDELSASWQVDADDTNDYVGWGAALTDLDGDGLLDVAIGATQDELYGGSSTTGVVGWFAATDVLTSTNALMADAQELWAPEEQSQQFGVDLGAAGDIDGDGLADLIAPAPRGQLVGPDTPRVYPLYQGVPTMEAIDLPGDVLATLMGDRRSTTFFDADADGSLDLVAGAWSEAADGEDFNSGEVHVFQATGTGWEVESLRPFDAPPERSGNDRLGWATANAGDFDGDGRDDLVLVAYNDMLPGAFDELVYTNPDDCPAGSNVGGTGAAWIHRGLASGVASTPMFVVHGYGSGDHIERAAGGLDIDRDGFGDLVIGSVGTDTTGGFAVVRGRPRVAGGVTVICDAEWSLGASSGSRLGSDVAAAGDLDGDGCDDFAVGADADDLGVSNQGSVRIFWGDGVGCSGPGVTTLVVDDSNARFGDSVDAGMDGDGDGVPDVVGGAYSYDDGLSDQGAAFFAGGAWIAGLARDAAPGWSLPDDGSTTTHLVSTDGRILGATEREELGRGVAFVDDPHSGRALVAVGSRYGNDGAGGVTVWSVEDGLVAERPYALVAGETLAPWGQLGDEVQGHPDAPVLAVGAPFGDGTWIDQGVVYPFTLP